ncbi:Hypothetical_protein [Hexamita inflata]|uniref:Hypothetical_protein n=1 Tax=Hexamita inflata TaxID=28002 RepID=A0AA86NJU7_9EUKA|nr:Hypothetical protein HINF_LOCUS7941 [Hexamita inflata]
MFRLLFLNQFIVAEWVHIIRRTSLYLKQIGYSVKTQKSQKRCFGPLSGRNTYSGHYMIFEHNLYQRRRSVPKQGEVPAQVFQRAPTEFPPGIRSTVSKRYF